MTAQRHAAKPACEAHDIIALHRAPNWNCWYARSLFRRQRRLAADLGERPPDPGDQRIHLIRRYLVMPEIAGDDARNETQINSGAVVHRLRRPASASCFDIGRSAPLPYLHPLRFSGMSSRYINS